MRKTSLASAMLVAAVSFVPVQAGATTLVDPGSLVPPPPPGADCQENGVQTLCHTTFLVQYENEPVDVGLPCGTIYETVNDARVGLRWYDADGLLTKRLVTQDMEGSWSLSPEGQGPIVQISAHGGWGEVYPIPGDLESAVGQSHGEAFKLSSPGQGVIAHIAGREAPDGFHGSFEVPEDPAIGQAICTALGA